ncbi:MAG TPA: MarR family transcriptional regulator [Thermohalobaculum sp.]|nr:MarR family transcriptional regulator [Thermohalobaculum sp.]
MISDLMSPANCACFNLRRAARQATQAFDRALRPAGIQATQFTLLALLAQSGEADMPVTELAGRLGLDRTTLTRNLAVAERSGWLESRPGEDRRERRVALTDAGRAKLAAALPLWKSAQTRVVVEMGEDRMADLLTTLRQM